MKTRAPRVGLVTLGCPKNLVDSEVTLGILAKNGFDLAPSVEECDVALINTCAFIDASKKESIDNILELAELKNSGRIQGLVVMGCLSQKHGDEVRREIPEIDAILGTGDFDKISSTLKSVLRGKPVFQVSNPLYIYDETTPRLQLTPRHSRYIKVSEGCDHACAFCIIPQLRGKHRSRPLASIVEEARSMAESGVREINLIAQDLTYYGMDTEGKLLLPDLIRAMDQVPNVNWVRLFYAYPSLVTDAVIEAIRESRHICRYLDMPLQHASDRMLVAMRRGITQAKTKVLIEKLRSRIPDLSLRTTFIVGFPGETEEDFEQLTAFIRETRFDKVGVFTYSDEEHAVSHDFTGKVPQKIKEKRRDTLMSLQQEISFQIHRSLEGKIYDVLVDEITEKGDVIGRTHRDAPEIDGKVIVRKPASRTDPGDMISVKVTKGLDYDLEGEIVPSERA